MKFFGIRIVHIIAVVFIALTGFGQTLEKNSIGSVKLKKFKETPCF